MEHETKQESEHETEQESEHETEQKSEHETEHESEHETEHETEHEVEHETESKMEHETEHELEHETESKMEHEAESEMEHEKESEMEHETEPEMESETEPEMVSETKLETNSEMEHESELKTEHESEQKTEPITESEMEYETEHEMEYEIEEIKVHPITFSLVVIVDIAKQKFLKKLSKARKALRESRVQIKVPKFQTSLFKGSMETDTGYLTENCQRTMLKPPEERNENEIELAQDELRDIVFFQRFPHKIQNELFKVMNYLLVTEGRSILKEGHESCCMYIIISGVVKIFKLEDKKETKYEKVADKYELSNGSYFGYEDLIQERPRTISASCKIVCQLLELNKIDFDRLIRSYIINDEILIDKSLRSLKTISCFGWEEHEYEQLKYQVKLQKYSPRTLILGGETKICPLHVQFIIYGECIVEQEIEFVSENQIGFTRLRPVTSKTDVQKTDLQKTDVRKTDIRKTDVRKADVRKTDVRKTDVRKTGVRKARVQKTDVQRTEGGLKKQKTYLEIGVLRKSHYFGIGENMQNRFIKSDSVVETLMVPRLILIKKNVQVFDTMKTQFENSFPTVQEILDNYLEIKQWQRYKEKAIQQL